MYVIPLDAWVVLNGLSYNITQFNINKASKIWYVTQGHEHVDGNGAETNSSMIRTVMHSASGPHMLYKLSNI